MKTARELAADILCETEKGAKSTEVLKKLLDSCALSDSDRKFTGLLVNGVLEKQGEIDRELSQYSSKKLSSMRPIVRNVMRISLYQLMYLKDIPESAVCNEAVKIIDRRKIYGLKGYVNAVLRRISEKNPKPVKSEFPKFVRDIIAEREPERVNEIIEAFDIPSKLTCRFLLSKASEDEILALLDSDGIIAIKDERTKAGYKLSGYGKVGDIKAFAKGLIQIQDISSIIAAEALAPANASTVLDVCAAPGGKTIALADMVGRDGHIIARDLTEKKVKLIRENAERCGLDNISAQVMDATIYNAEDENKFDYILADLPCSGLGTLGHKKEIRYRVNLEKVLELSALQKKILKNVVRYLKPGGRMVYSTCTITRQENEENAAFIEGLGLKKISEQQLLPGIDGEVDGFFVSVFEKESE